MKQVKRSLIVFINILIIFIIVIFGLRAMGEEVYPGFADKLFGVKGVYGKSGEEKELEKEPVHAESREYCKKCHEGIYRKSSEGKHNFDCQTCHGPLEKHPSTEMTVINSREFCLECHKPTVGRDQATIRLISNWEEHGKGMLCTACHDPHHPWFD